MNSQDVLRALQAGKITPEDAKKEIEKMKVLELKRPMDSESLGLSNDQKSYLQLSSQFYKEEKEIDNKKVAGLNLLKPRDNCEHKFSTVQSLNQEQVKEGIAIIGISGQFPKSKNICEFWDNLSKGVDCISEIPATRWSIEDYYDEDPKVPGKTYCKWMGVLEDIEKFDPLFFNISPVEAELMDPQQRLFLENCWHCIEDAGLNPGSLSGSRCGVFVGCETGDYKQLINEYESNLQGYMGSAISFLSARISYLLNLRGPCLTIDTACSSSLVSIVEACNSLILRTSDLALAGGVNILITPSTHVITSKGGMLSKDGRCFTFDTRANGFVPGEGVGVILLKRLFDAVHDNDPIYGVIRGWGVNQDGRTNGITAPSVNSQIMLEKEVFERFNINPETISLVEAHGTGTKLGDPIEVEALTESFHAFTHKKNYCALGSVKSNIGHLLMAAGVAGVIKVLLAMKNRMLPPTINYKTLNEHISLDNSPFFINTELKPWEVISGILRCASVSSFGLSGTNAYIVVEEYLPQNDIAKISIPNSTNNPILFMLSAKSKEQLKTYVESMKNFIESQKDLDLADIAYTLQVGREAMDYRLAFVADSREVLLKKMAGFINNEVMAEVFTAHVKRNKEGMLFESARDAKALLETWVQKKKLKNIAEVWVQGLSIDWSQLYGDIKPRRINLPTYPFARECYWFSKAETKSAINGTSPAISKFQPPNIEKVILLKDWKQKSIELKTKIQAGVLVVLGTSHIKKLASALFKDMKAIKVIQVIHGETVSSDGIATDFYSEKAGEFLYQQIKNFQNAQQLLGVIDVTAYDSIYEQSVTVEAGKIIFLQKLLECNRNDGYKLLQVTHRLNDFEIDNLTMQGARLAGLYRMLGAEYRQIQSMTMDCDNLIKYYNKLADQIQAEFLNGNKENITECCYRNGKRYEPLLTVSQTNREIQKDLLIRGKYEEHEVILITGGSRGIGIAIAEHLVSQGVKNLIIMGRENLPKPNEWKNIIENKEKPEIEEKLRRMQSFIDQGVKVHYYSTVLTDQSGIKAMIQSIHQDLGPITGVIHCAGLTSKNPAFIKKLLSEIEEVCEPKMKGLTTLHKALENEPLGFFILFSSISSIAPSLAAGHSDYCMANAYMDYYAVNQVSKGKSYFKSIQWPMWGETGMAAGVVRIPAYMKTGLVPQATIDGLAFFDIIKKKSYTLSLPCVAVPSEFVFDQLLNTEITVFTKDTNSDISEVSQANSQRFLTIESELDLQTKIVQWVREIFISELKLTIDQLDEDKPFHEYGIDSIILAQLAQKMQEKLGQNVDPSLLLEHSSIVELTDYFVNNYAGVFQKNLGFSIDNTVEKTYISSLSRNLELHDPITKQVTIGSLEELTKDNPKVEDIAVIGLSCRFPDSSSKEAFWELLTKGISTLKPISKERWISKDGRVDYGGWVDGIDMFDSQFFNITDEDAAIMDPQARIILEESLKAIYDAGYEHRQLWGKKVGIYIGGRLQSSIDMNAIFKAPNPILGSGQNYLATNISRFFNFNGPSLVIDTACSSGLTGMSFAVDSLQRRRIDMALVGAVSILSNSFAHDLFASRNILNKKGEFHIFDKRASGEVLGEGAGVVILKRLSEAIRDGNQIYGIIKAIAINNDGRTLGPGSPNINAQKQVIQEALLLSGKQPQDIGYIEVNGGGSTMVDSVEIKALSSAYNLDNRNLEQCYLGSVKPNIGHLLLTSGLAGFIRCLLSVYYKQIPPFLSALEPFEYYDFPASRIHFNREVLNWKVDSGKKRIAAQNSFPDGGTNCHVIVEEFIPDKSYRQRYFQIPVPNMTKKCYPLLSSSFPSSIKMDGKEDFPPGIEMHNLIETFRKQPNRDTEREQHEPIQFIWGEIK